MDTPQPLEEITIAHFRCTDVSRIKEYAIGKHKKPIEAIATNYKTQENDRYLYPNSP
jgi:hypothetical protein